jgi:hypothetical protein
MLVSFKNLLENHSARKAQIYRKASSHGADSSLSNVYSKGLEVAIIGKMMLACVYTEKRLTIFSSRTTREISF